VVNGVVLELDLLFLQVKVLLLLMGRDLARAPTF
jgi:hypothetical protein